MDDKGPHWTKVKRLFQATMACVPADRPAYLAEACDGDQSLLQEVRSLLEAHEAVGEFIDRPAVQRIKQQPRPPLIDPNGSDLETMFPDYALLRPCGRGAFGEVWIVRDRVGTYRAMKVLDAGRMAERGIQHREIQALQHYCQNVSDHSNLVRVFHVGELHGFVYYTMELADDLTTRAVVRQTVSETYKPMTLSGILRTGRLNADTAVAVTQRLLRGLMKLHEVGLVHRDVKPANILFVAREVKLTDISLISHTQTRMSMVGTPRYMPPDDCMDTTADTYAVGKVLYEMLTGGNMTVFPRLPDDAGLASTRVDLDKLERFLVKACATTALKRFASARDMLDALMACRFPLHDAPLLELASDSMSGTIVPDAQASTDPQVDAYIAAAQDHRRLGDPHVAVWAVLDRLIRVVPWGVVLILGIYLIRQLT
jgi:serine/threonine protein kinase